QLALLAHRLQDRRAPVLQLPQIAQPLLDGAQLRVVEHLGGLLAVAGDEGHRRTAVEQLHRCSDLPLPYAELLGDPAFDGPCGGCRHDPVPPYPSRLGRQLCQAARTAGGVGSPESPGGAERRVSAPRPGSPAQARRVLPDAPPKRRARARNGSVTTVAMAPPIWRSTSAMARNTGFPFRAPDGRAGRPAGTLSR